MQRRTALLAGLFAVFAVQGRAASPAEPAPGTASWATFDRAPRQGGLIFGRVPPGSRLRFAGRDLAPDAAGRFVLGFDRDAPAREELRVASPDGRTETLTLAVAPRSYAVQRVDSLPPARVTPRTPKERARIAREALLLRAARASASELDGFARPALRPTAGVVTGVYGSRRVLNGLPRAPHRGLDIAAPEGAPVGAALPGVVTLAEPDLYFTGGTVVLDHGRGLFTIYAHLSKVNAVVGRRVASGGRIGAVGATGRATGPHLHFGVYWFDRAVDPEALIGPASPGAVAGEAGG